MTTVKLRYPNCALIRLRIDSEQFSAQPKIGLKLRLLRIKVPTNYNPVTRINSGVWNGTFKIAWTDNPAWILYDLLTSKRYGAGQRIDASSVDKWGFYEAARYCDERVPIPGVANRALLATAISQIAKKPMTCLTP